MSSQAEITETAAETGRLGAQVQAGIGRVAKFANGKTRDWSLFIFFRILPGQVAATRENPDAAAAEESPGPQLAGITKERLLNPRLFEPVSGLEDEDDATGVSSTAAPSERFRKWLLLLTEPENPELQPWLSAFQAELKNLADPQIEAGIETEEVEEPSEILDADRLEETMRSLSEADTDLAQIEQLRRYYQSIAGVGEDNAQGRESVLQQLLELGDGENLTAWFSRMGADIGEQGRLGLIGGLPMMYLHTLLRLFAPALLEQHKDAPIRSEDQADAQAGFALYDKSPTTIAFTHAGLASLGVDPDTLASFPAAFREGMAARAERLGDTGTSGPTHWYGELGLPSVHGYFQTGFQIGDAAAQSNPAFLEALRKDIAAFNERDGELGDALRIILNALSLPCGMEIVHIEFGENPYAPPDEDGKRPDYRVEHFGFRDGLSQPYVDMELEDPPAGGGTPSLRNTWTPVAPGEIFLNRPDEDGHKHQEPRNEALCEGATYLVFRKLAQDVAGFNAFLQKQRPHCDAEQERLAAQMVGRWKNGTSLVQAPEVPGYAGDEDTINDFRYAEDDPQGRKCPLGAHVRRANPRDIGGNNDVRRHRLLRRAIGYGGPLLPAGSSGDGVERGLLFVAANARIDQQFELVQSRWINGGEFLGQAGLGKCPLTGANSGTVVDQFLEAGAAAPVAGVPQFVTMRGGDYFFAPGIRTLVSMALGKSFPPETDNSIDRGRSFGDYETLGLFHPKRVKRLVAEIIADPANAKKVALTLPGTGGSVAFVRRHEDVKFLFALDFGGQDPAPVTVRHLEEAGRRVTSGHDIIVGTQYFTPTGPARERMKETLEAAWKAMASSGPQQRTRDIARARCEAALRRFGPARRIDLVQDLMTPSVYGFVDEVLGVPGPDHLTELAMALPFGKQFVGQIHPDWLRAARGGDVENKPQTTMQIWSALLLADLIGNVHDTAMLKVLARQAASEMLMHIDLLLARAMRVPTNHPRTLLDAFVTAMPGRLPDYPGQAAEEKVAAYLADVRAILLELAGTSMATVPHSFGHVMQTLLRHAVPTPRIIGALRVWAGGDPAKFSAGLQQFILEAERLNPGARVALRYCAADRPLPSGDLLYEGEWVALATVAANFDADAFPDPLAFSIPALDPQAPERKEENYLMFGYGADRKCWGHEKVAMAMLEEVTVAAARLQALRPVAGPDGIPRRLVLPVVGLNARFDAVLP